MEYVRITKDNLEKEHVCCAISNNKDSQVIAKKNWLSERLDDGLVFLKGDVRGKFFIEYLPAEKAWAPIEADGYTYIDCFWIAGQFKGHGYANELLDECIRDSKAKGRTGICVLSSQPKKKPFLSDPEYLAHRGFKLADKSAPFFALLYLPFYENSPIPKFRECAKTPRIDDKGFVLYYADQCPYTAKYVPLLQKTAADSGITLKTVHIQTTKQAQNAPTPFTAFTLFYNGKFITNEILSEQRFIKIISEYEKI